VLIITYQVMLKLNKNTSPLPRQALDEVASRVKGSGEVTCICPECLKDRNVCVCEILPDAMRNLADEMSLFSFNYTCVCE